MTQSQLVERVMPKPATSRKLESPVYIEGGNDPMLRIQSDGTDEISGRLSLRQKNRTGADLYYDGRSKGETAESFVIETFAGGRSKGRALSIRYDGAIEAERDLDVAGTVEISGPLDASRLRSTFSFTQSRRWPSVGAIAMIEDGESRPHYVSATAEHASRIVGVVERLVPFWPFHLPIDLGTARIPRLRTLMGPSRGPDGAKVPQREWTRDELQQWLSKLHPEVLDEDQVKEALSQVEHGKLELLPPWRRGRIVTSGVVETRIEAEDGAILPGDLLTVSHRHAGYAAKAKKIVPGTILGKALERVEAGKKGEYSVLVALS